MWLGKGECTARRRARRAEIATSSRHGARVVPSDEVALALNLERACRREGDEERVPVQCVQAW